MGDATEGDNITDIYSMITINCKYKKNIQKLLQFLKDIKKRKKELEDKYA